MRKIKVSGTTATSNGKTLAYLVGNYILLPGGKMIGLLFGGKVYSNNYQVIGAFADSKSISMEAMFMRAINLLPIP